MIGLILISIYFGVLAIATIIFYPIGLLIGLFSKKAKDYYSLGFVQIVMRGFIFLSGAKIEYKGLENLPPKGEAVVYIGNHRGFYDVVCSFAVMPDLTGFVAKKEMEKWPLFGWWMKAVHCLFLDRNDRRQGLATILKGIEQVKSGISMFIYPEGTRSKVEGTLGTFHGGSFKLATKSKVKLIPVASSNSGEIWDDHKPWIHPVRMCLEFMEPIDTASLSRAEIETLPARVQELIQNKIIENGKAIGSLPEDYHA